MANKYELDFKRLAKATGTQKPDGPDLIIAASYDDQMEFYLSCRDPDQFCLNVMQGMLTATRQVHDGDLRMASLALVDGLMKISMEMAAQEEGRASETRH